ncbi:MAG: hypothetical protein WKG01_25890 [Kofleriaceae bacterium]
MKSVTTKFGMMLVGLFGGACGALDESPSTTTNELNSPDRLEAGESLAPDQSISSAGTSLVYQGDNNLVLYQAGTPVWASSAGAGEPANLFVMQDDCNAVVYGGHGAVWSSGTSGQGGGCYAKVVEGDWVVCSGADRVFSARGGGDCNDDGGGGDPLAEMARIGGDGDQVAAYLIHMFVNTEISVYGVQRTLWDMVDKSKFMVVLGGNGAGLDSYRVIYHYTGEGHWMISQAQQAGGIRYRNADSGASTGWFGFTQGGPFDPTLAHPNMDHAYKSLFEESGKDLCLQPQWNDGSTVGEIDIDFHRQWEVEDHGRPDNSDPITMCSGGCKNNNAYYRAAWGSPGGLPGYAGPMIVRQTDRGPVLDFGQQRFMPGFQEVATVLGGRGIGVITGEAVPR